MIKILVIDDDPDVRKVLEIVMTKQGYEVETASRKDEAMEKLENSRPSLILLDVLLSGSDGREICREIKANHSLCHIPVIMVSAHPGASDNFNSYGADDFVTKPIRTEILLEKVEQLLKPVQ